MCGDCNKCVCHWWPVLNLPFKFKIHITFIFVISSAQVLLCAVGIDSFLCCFDDYESIVVRNYLGSFAQILMSDDRLVQKSFPHPNLSTYIHFHRIEIRNFFFINFYNFHKNGGAEPDHKAPVGKLPQSM